MLLYPGDRAHIPEVGGSIPLPPTRNYKGLAITPFLFLRPVSKWGQKVPEISMIDDFWRKSLSLAS